jgi:hypothetical protein
MPDSLYHVAQAAETLAGPHGTAKEKLVKAGGEFWAAMIYREEWTPELQVRAERICQTLLAGGTVEMTVNQMDSDTAARTATELTAALARLAADIARARDESRLPSQQSGFRHQDE